MAKKNSQSAPKKGSFELSESLQKKSVGEVPLTQTQSPAFEFPKSKTPQKSNKFEK